MNKRGFFEFDLDDLNWGVVGLACAAGILAFFIAGYAGYSGFFGRLITALVTVLVSYFIVGGIANR